MNTISELLQGLWSLISRAVISAFPLIDTTFVVFAGILGMHWYGRFKPSTRDIILKALGIGVVLFAVVELWNGLFVLQDGQIETEGTLLAVIALPLGYLFGEALAVDRLLGKLGLWLHGLYEKKSPAPKDKKSQLTREEAARLVLHREDTATGFIIAVTLSGCSSLIFSPISSSSFAVSDISQSIPCILSRPRWASSKERMERLSLSYTPLNF